MALPEDDAVAVVADETANHDSAEADAAAATAEILAGPVGIATEEVLTSNVPDPTSVNIAEPQETHDTQDPDYVGAPDMSAAPASAARVVTAGEADVKAETTAEGDEVHLDHATALEGQQQEHQLHEQHQDQHHDISTMHDVAHTIPVMSPAASAIAAAAAVAQQQHPMATAPDQPSVGAPLVDGAEMQSVPTPFAHEHHQPPASIPAMDHGMPGAVEDAAAAVAYSYEPTDRDVLVDESGHSNHIANRLLNDLIRLHRILRCAADESQEEDAKRYAFHDDDEMARHLTDLMVFGKKYELAGIKDVPKQFLVGKGRFLRRNGMVLEEVTDDEAQAYVKSLIQIDAQIAEAGSQNPHAPMSTTMAADGSLVMIPSNQDPSFEESRIKQIATVVIEKMQPKSKDEAGEAMPLPNSPRACDILFLPAGYAMDDSMLYEQQTGNKTLLLEASRLVSVDTDSSPKRVHAAQKLVTTQLSISFGNEILKKNPMYIIQLPQESHTIWKELNPIEISEFAVIFVFEIFLEKQLHGTPPLPPAYTARTKGRTHADLAGPSTNPVPDPTPHDVLFGRGGMTNNHPGNRRFRDIIALHRPDYVRASKMEKPNVARKIVRAIRHGNPPGRFLKKGDDGLWYDVGDRCAAEKTSQGLRERTNAEKRQRLEHRESVRVRGDNGIEIEDPFTSVKKQKVDHQGLIEPVLPTTAAAAAAAAAYTGVIAHPLAAAAAHAAMPTAAKEKPRDMMDRSAGHTGQVVVVAATEANAGAPLPPLAVDENGDILPTDHDILCGRGGLTNHHKGNKRYRDIVALHRPDYVRAAKIQKPGVAKMIVKAIRGGDTPGRFLKKDERTGKWVDIGDKRAAEKTSQALREKAPNEKSGGEISSPNHYGSPSPYYPSHLAPNGASMLPMAPTGVVPIQPYPQAGVTMASLAPPAPMAPSVPQEQETASASMKLESTAASSYSQPAAAAQDEEDAVTAEVIEEGVANSEETTQPLDQPGDTQDGLTQVNIVSEIEAANGGNEEIKQEPAADQVEV